MKLLKNEAIKFLLSGLVLFVSLACGSSGEPPPVVILTRLPTLTPTPSDNTATEAQLPAEQVTMEPVELVQPPTEQVPLAPDSSPPQAEQTNPTEPSSAAQSVDGASVIIIAINDLEEHMDLQNVSDETQDLEGWRLYSELGGEECLLGGVIQPGEMLRVWTRAIDMDKGGYNCGAERAIWKDSKPDVVILYDSSGMETSQID